MRSEGYGTWFIWVCVCVSLAILALKATKQYQSDTKSISASSALKLKCFFPETTCTVFKSYGVKTIEKAILAAKNLEITRFP